MGRFRPSSIVSDCSQSRLANVAEDTQAYVDDLHGFTWDAEPVNPIMLVGELVEDLIQVAMSENAFWKVERELIALTVG